jgi:hypothetical protein
MDYVFIRYIYNNNAYQFLVHESSIKDIHPNTIMESIDAIFFEMCFHLKKHK